jgi:hypothetical protein
MDASNESRFNRMIAWLTRGEVPLDGFCIADENLAPPVKSPAEDMAECVREAEDAGLISRAPVRWGSFR